MVQRVRASFFVAAGRTATSVLNTRHNSGYHKETGSLLPLAEEEMAMVDDEISGAEAAGAPGASEALAGRSV
jgi:hypothetical protein